MKKKLLFICLLFTLSTAVYSQESYLVTRLNLGDHSGPNFDFGLGMFVVSDAGDFTTEYETINRFLKFVGGSATLGYEWAKIQDKNFCGPKTHLKFFLTFIEVGINASYLDNGNQSKMVIKSEIGLTLIGILSLNYSHLLTDVDDFFPKGYSKS